MYFGTLQSVRSHQRYYIPIFISENNQKYIKNVTNKMQEIYGSKEFWHVASQNCSDMMLRVSWKYNDNYTKEFFPAQNYPTDYGACCVISPFMDFENEENEKGHHHSPGKHDGMDYHLIPKGKTHNGIRNGLQVTLDLESFDYAYISRSAEGFR